MSEPLETLQHSETEPTAGLKSPKDIAALLAAQIVPGLYVVATPIGHLGDMTFRAVAVLQAANIIACEDTRTSRSLLAHYGIAADSSTLWAVHEHNEQTQAAALAERVRAGAVAAVITDAGTPGISDPGARVVAHFREQQLPVFAVPGASAITAALSVSGVLETAFEFAGFLPASAGERKRALQRIAAAAHATVVYESPHRIEAALEHAQTVLGADARVFIARELTKRFETTGWHTIGEALAVIKNDSNQARGEFVLIFPAAATEAANISSALPVLEMLLAELPPAKAAKLASKITGIDKDSLYNAAMELKK